MKNHKLTPIGKRVIKRLKELDRTQLSLANELGISKQSLNGVLYGRSASLRIEAMLIVWLS